jgi:hypothetical protein
VLCWQIWDSEKSSLAEALVTEALMAEALMPAALAA